MNMEDWTEAHWQNLETQANRILMLCQTRKRDLSNPAWRTKLRLALYAIEGFLLDRKEI